MKKMRLLLLVANIFLLAGCASQCDACKYIHFSPEPNNQQDFE